MTFYNEIRDFNSIIVKAFSSSQESLDILSSFSIENKPPSFFVDILFCDDSNICCEKTKLISMKILTEYYENNLSADLVDQIDNYYNINFSSNDYNSSLISSPFSIDLFASVFKKFPEKSIQTLNNFFSMGIDHYRIAIAYTIRYVNKLQKTDGFEDILLTIFQQLPKMSNIFNEMISINSIFKLFLPTIVSEKIHVNLFEYYETDEDVCKVLKKLLRLNYLFENKEQFNDFVSDYISVFNEIITNDAELLWKTELLLELRKTDSFRELQFDQFFIDLIQKIFSKLENSFENFTRSIEITINLINFFGNIDQLNCNSVSEEALKFNKEMMDNCRKLIIENLNKIEYDDKEEPNSSISFFYETCSKLFVDDYINSMNDLIEVYSLSSFSIIKEMVLNHKNKSFTSYSEFIETDQNCLISFIEIEKKPINFSIDFLYSFLEIYNPNSNHFIDEYFQALINLIENLQKTQDIDLEVLKKSMKCIEQIPVLDENKFDFLIEDPLFPFIGNQNNRKEMKPFFKMISSFSFIDQIIENILKFLDLETEIILDYLEEIPLSLIFDEIIPILKAKFIPNTDPLNILNFIYYTIKRIEKNYFPFMSEELIITIKTLCEILNDFLINNSDSFPIQRKILKSITVILKIKWLNIGVFLFYDDDFILDLISKNIELLNEFDIEIVCKDFNFILKYFNTFYTNLGFSQELLNDDSILLLLKIALFQVQQDYFDFDLINNIFKIIRLLIENERISEPIEGLTDSLLEESLNKGSYNKLPFSMYLTIQSLFQIHQDLFSSIVHLIISNNESESSRIGDIADAIMNGTNEQIAINLKLLLDFYEDILEHDKNTQARQEDVED